MIRTSPTRFFLVVAPAPVWITVGFGAAVVLAAVTLWLNPREVDSALGTVMLLQMFACSSGYAAAAGRGHFDPLIVSGRPWRAIVLGHLLATALPGLIAWAITASIAAILGHPAAALSPHRHVAILLVSTSSWAAGLLLPPLTAGALWSSLLIGLAFSRIAVGDVLAAAQHAPSDFLGAVASACASALCPFLLLGDLPGMRDWRVAALDALFAATVVLLGARVIASRDYALRIEG